MQLHLENVCFIRRGFSNFKKLFSNSAPPSKSHKQSPRPTFNQPVYFPISQLHYAINLKIHTSPKNTSLQFNCPPPRHLKCIPVFFSFFSICQPQYIGLASNQGKCGKKKTSSLEFDLRRLKGSDIIYYEDAV